MIGFSGCNTTGRTSMSELIAKQLNFEYYGSISKKLASLMKTNGNLSVFFSDIYKDPDRTTNFQMAVHSELYRIQSEYRDFPIVINKTLGDVYAYTFMYKEKMKREVNRGIEIPGFDSAAIFLENIMSKCLENFSPSSFDCIIFMDKRNMNEDDCLYQEKLTEFFTLNNRQIIRMNDPTFFEVLNVVLDHIDVKKTFAYKQLVELQTLSNRFKSELNF